MRTTVRRGLLGGAVLIVSLAASSAAFVVLGVPARWRCGASDPFLVAGKDTGFANCASGLLHRPSKRACPSLIPRPDEVISSRRVPGYQPVFPLRPGGCRFDRDCTAAPNGYCTEPLPSGPTTCAYGCVDDADCGVGHVCLCGNPVGRCVVASCIVDADCEGLSTCARYSPSPGCFYEDGFACQSRRDACSTALDCKQGENCGWEAGTRTCTRNWCSY